MGVCNHSGMCDCLRVTSYQKMILVHRASLLRESGSCMHSLNAFSSRGDAKVARQKARTVATVKAFILVQT